MTRLEFPFTNDILFKMLFVKNPDLLENLVSALLRIPAGSITSFAITNPDIPPELVGEKFCRLDINMVVNGQIVDLEIQVANEGDFPERSLYYWARAYSSSLKESVPYSELPRTVIISILAFKLFEREHYWSNFTLRELEDGEVLSDKIELIYFELTKLPKTIDTGNKLELWLSLLKVKTEEKLKKFEHSGIPEMQKMVTEYRDVTVAKDFLQIQRALSDARHAEAQAVFNAEQRGEKRGAKIERKKWEEVVSIKDSELERKDSELERKDSELERKDSELERKDLELELKDSELERKDAIIENLLAQIEESKNHKTRSVECNS